MLEWLRAALDLVLIVTVGTGLVQAGRLIKQLAGLRQGRIEMERFVHDFNATVMRAENGIKGLRNAARDSGDDLERLVEKAQLVRDELQFLVESGDTIAERLSRSAASAMQPAVQPAAPVVRPAVVKPVVAEPAAATPAAPAAPAKAEAPPASKAEKELLQALQKLN